MGDTIYGKHFYQMDCTDLDVLAIALDLHPDDEKELIAGEFLTPDISKHDCLKRCVANSAKTYAIRCNMTDLTMAIGGYTESGNCWFISSNWLLEFTPDERKDFRNILMQNLMNTLKLFPVVCNAAWAKNEQHLRLIKSCGGHIGDTGYMPNGEEFVYFEFRREDYPQLN